ncbi:MAG: AmmeMemoRadiSam system protein B [Desulfobacteraceae bacterium 4572_89]|nr:MAG: AmmeMemoRadiSam system protein B [Desulfobacteraceae bacterium 4572_89]
MEKKKAAFAGTWYPGTAQECEASIQKYVKEGQGRIDGEFTGGIVPHAGWFYSGSIACRVIASLQLQGEEKDSIDTIVLFGAHMHRQSEPFIMTRGVIETPFGDLEVDGELVKKITSSLSILKLSPLKFPDENTFELQYPFIKYFFPKSKIVVCGVTPSPFASEIGSRAVEKAKALGRLIRVIGSTDMTHYGPDFGFTPAGVGEKAFEWVTKENDRNAVRAMMEMDGQKILAQGLDHKNMCCAGAAAATVEACKKMGAVKAVELDYATSFEKSRSDSFVGYAGLVYGRS